jgi:hypothetical protein
MEIVCNTTLALGSNQLSKSGAIVSRLAAIEDLSGERLITPNRRFRSASLQYDLLSFVPTDLARPVLESWIS